VYRDKRVTVAFDLPPECDVPIEQGALLELLGNLLENAYRLCLSEVRISLVESLEGTELCIEDDGPGVPPDQRARILQRGEGWTVSIRGRASAGGGQGHHRKLRRAPDPGGFNTGGAAFRIHFRP
jgi:two-component system sensor histidine kinase PhoQ